MHTNLRAWMRGSRKNVSFSPQRAVQTSPQEAIGPNGSNCFSRGVCTSISKENYSPLVIDFPGGSEPRPPFGSAHAELLFCCMLSQVIIVCFCCCLHDFFSKLTFSKNSVKNASSDCQTIWLH